MTRFGPGVIGQKAYDDIIGEEERTSKGRFGPGVVGEKRHDSFGPAIVRPGVELPSDLASVSVKDLKGLLDKDSGLATELFAAEKARPDGPRVSALRALQFSEAKNDVPNEDMLAEMKALAEGDGS